MTGCDCRACGRMVGDYSDDGFELPDGQRWHWCCLPAWYRSLVMTGGFAWEAAETEFDRYQDNGGRVGWLYFVQRYYVEEGV